MKIASLTLILFAQFWNFGISQDVMFEIYGFGQDQEKAYVSLDNRIKILIEGKLCDEFTVRTNNGKIYKREEGCEYIYNPIAFRQTDLDICLIQEGDTTVFKTIKLHVAPLPFKFSIGSEFVECKLRQKITKSKFLNTGFSMYSLNMNIDANLPVLGFEVSVFRRGAEIFNEELTKYNKTTEKELKSKLEIIASGDIVKISQLVYRYFDGSDVYFDSFEIEIE